MPDSPGSDASHESVDESTGAHSNKAHAVKDRKCQYCGQPFTSSSLGRHLDQYLHKKKPDGVHNVDEIRRLRGGITRRTARHSKAHEDDETSVADRSPAPPPAGTPVVDNLNDPPIGGLGTRLNAPHWHTTGVITDLSDINNGSPSTPLSAVVSAKRPFSSLSASEPVSSSEKDTSRALELALREVLDSLRAATARASPRSSPFTFDLQSRTFPSLCLTLLSTPPTLFSPSPFATSTSVPLDPPSSTHLELLRLQISSQIQHWKWDSLRTAQSHTFTSATAANLGEEADYLSRTALQYEELATKHLNLAYSTWMNHPIESRQQMWQIELMRAFATEQAKAKEMEERIERITQEANRLQGQVEHLSRCQWPREMALWPPERIRFSKDEANEIRAVNLNAGLEDAGGSGGDKWDYERLVGKWQKHVRDDKIRRTGVTMQNHNRNQNPSSTAPLPLQPTSAKAGQIIPQPAALDHYAAAATSKKPRLVEVDGNSPNTNLYVNGTSEGEAGRRKSIRQQQRPLDMVTGLADQTDELRELKQLMRDMI